VTALAHSFARIWLAKDRLPHRTWWGKSGSRNVTTDKTTLVRWAHDTVLQFLELAQRGTPTVVAIALNILR
jgi:hypothetical protein